MTLAELIKAGYDVTRWHTMPNSRPQNLASHLWGVAMILIRTFPGSEKDKFLLLRVALEHDLAESIIGDMPKPARTEEHEAYERRVCSAEGIWHEYILPPHLVPWFKYADLIEAGLHCLREMNVGNQNFIPVAFRITERLYKEQNEVPGPLWEFAKEARIVS